MEPLHTSTPRFGQQRSLVSKNAGSVRSGPQNRILVGLCGGRGLPWLPVRTFPEPEGLDLVILGTLLPLERLSFLPPKQALILNPLATGGETKANLETLLHPAGLRNQC